MAKKITSPATGFGTMPVYLTTLSTILGAILFLRFGYAVAHTNFFGTLGIILIGHLITIPTALAVAEIATNQRVEGGGAYFIISRSFGLNTGGAIGIALYLSQAISVAFYVIAFSESFVPLLQDVPEQYTWIVNKQVIALVSMGLLSVLMISRGADVGMQALYVVAGVLIISIGMFLFGKPLIEPSEVDFRATVQNPDDFFHVFTIIFPAFTGVVAGLGLSGSLKNPKQSIPAGTLLATVTGLIVYIIIAYKMATSFSPDTMNDDPLAMQQVALWGPIIPIGLACASISSALGSIIVAPRTLQAMGIDRIFPNTKMNFLLSKESKKTNEPFNASVISILIAFFFIAIGDINFVAEIISMFFIVTYGFICLISFLEHFAADPAYRPTFRSKWYYSFIGAVLSFWVMFKMNFTYALMSMVIMAGFYMLLTYTNPKHRGIANLFRGVFFQLNRTLQVFLQRADKEDIDTHWRPFAICVTDDTFKRQSALDMLRWIGFKYGFGTFIHYIKGILNEETNKEAKDSLSRLLEIAKGTKNRVYLDTIISPSYTSAIAQVIQLSGVSGKGNNMILFEFSPTEPEKLEQALQHYSLLQSSKFDVCILNTSYKGFGYKQQIHIWITVNDYENANLMILMAYIMLGHPEWKKGVIKIYALYPENELKEQEKHLQELIQSGRLPISKKNVNLIPFTQEQNPKEIITSYSTDADLTIVGFLDEHINDMEKFIGYGNVGNILFVNAFKEKEIALLQ